jgi:hypothetical protein
MERGPEERVAFIAKMMLPGMLARMANIREHLKIPWQQWDEAVDATDFNGICLSLAQMAAGVERGEI